MCELCFMCFRFKFRIMFFFTKILYYVVTGSFLKNKIQNLLQVLYICKGGIVRVCDYYLRESE